MWYDCRAMGSKQCPKIILEGTRSPFDAIVFDLGGVLIELGGVTRMLELLDHRITVEELWTRWLSSPCVC